MPPQVLSRRGSPGHGTSAISSSPISIGANEHGPISALLKSPCGQYPTHRHTSAPKSKRACAPQAAVRVLRPGGATGLALYLWSHNQVSAGVAAVIAMALRLAGYSHWVIWQMTGHHSRRHQHADQTPHLVDARLGCASTRGPMHRPETKPVQVPHGEIRFEHDPTETAMGGTLPHVARSLDGLSGGSRGWGQFWHGGLRVSRAAVRALAQALAHPRG